MLFQALEELEVEASFEARSFVLQSIYAAVEKATVESKIQNRVHGDYNHPKIGRMIDAQMWHSSQASCSSSMVVPQIPCLVNPKKGTYAVRRPPGTSSQVLPTQAERESEVLKKCQALRVFYVMESNTPSAGAAASSSDQRRALASLIGKTRGSTAGMYLRRWTIMREWLLLSGLKA